MPKMLHSGILHLDFVVGFFLLWCDQKILFWWN